MDPRNKKKAMKAFEDNNSDIQMKNEDEESSDKDQNQDFYMKNASETNYYNFYKEDRLDDEFEQIDISSDKVKGSCNGAEAGSDSDSDDDEFCGKLSKTALRTQYHNTWLSNFDLECEDVSDRKEEEKEVVARLDNNSDTKSNGDKDDDNQLAYFNKKKNQKDDFSKASQSKAKVQQPWKHKMKAYYSNDDSDDDQIVTRKRK